MTRPSTGDAVLLTGWGRTAPSRASVVRPRRVDDIVQALGTVGTRGALPRGLGRSYGDVAQDGGGLVFDMTTMDAPSALDERRGTLTAGSGASFDRILRAIVPRGWFLSVTPGTRFVTVGGALASDVHGKNHHREGSIGMHLDSFELLDAEGVTHTVTPSGNTEGFRATLGGLGLTGIVTSATLRLVRIETSRIRVDTTRANDLDELMARMESTDDRYRYSVAWVDARARGRHLGRGVLMRGDHATVAELPARLRSRPLRYRPRAIATVPPGIPDMMSSAPARAMNGIWFHKAPRHERGRLVPLAAFFYPLDALACWNRLYGRRGFVQYQFVVPFGEERVVREVLEQLARTRIPSFLAVLKRFGMGRGMLSFPIPGWTLALDIPAAVPGLGEILDAVDRLVAEAGGRVYLAKDARLDPALLSVMYPELDRWREVRERLDPSHVFRSDLDRRLGLTSKQRRGVFA